MKTLLRLTLVSAVLALLVFGCKKPVQPDQATANDVRTAELAQSDVFTFSQQNTDGGKAFLDSGCVDVDVDSDGDIITTTLTFDGECAFEDGVVRSGQIIINWEMGWRFDSTKQAVITFNNFTRDSVVVSGKVTMHFAGHNADGSPIYKSTEEDMSVKFADGKTATWSGNRTVEWTEGYKTLRDRFDDVRKINFHREGINRNGEAYTADGTDVVMKNECGTTRKTRAVSGTVVIKKGDSTITLDFGDGECDDSFTITQNGVTITVNG